MSAQIDTQYGEASRRYFERSMAGVEKVRTYLASEVDRKRQIWARARFPAFGRKLMELRLQGQVPKPHPWFGHVLVALDHWQWGEFMTRLVVPPQADPAALDYSMLAGLDVIVGYSRHYTYPCERLTLLLKCLVHADVASLRVIDTDFPKQGFFVKSHALGIERAEYAS